MPEPDLPNNLNSSQEAENAQQSDKDLENSEEIPIEVEIINNETSEIMEKTIELLKNNFICKECLGRQFGLLSTGTDNTSRAEAILSNIIMECHSHLKKCTPNQQFHLFGEHPLNLLYLIEQRSNTQNVTEIIKKWMETHPELVPSDFSYNQENNTISSNFKCNFCKNILLPEKIEEIVNQIIKRISEYEFDSFLLGTSVAPIISNFEEETRSRFDLLNGEAFKANVNRVIGIKLQNSLNKEVKFSNPTLQIILQLTNDYIRGIKDMEIQLIPISLYAKGKYKKFSRELPQTEWNCYKCFGRRRDREGKMCMTCKGKGRIYNTSVKELIEEVLVEYTGAKEGVFHGAGREDYNARCLGTGRSFIIEAKHPKIRSVDLDGLQSEINKRFGKLIHISKLNFSDKKEVVQVKNGAEFTRKKYHALVEFSDYLTKEEFMEKLNHLKKIMVGNIIHQKTPIRVMKRRADKIRDKKIHSIEGKYIDSIHCFFKIEAQGGTYIKELISGDKERTVPSFTQLFGMKALCVELDVIKIED